MTEYENGIAAIVAIAFIGLVISIHTIWDHRGAPGDRAASKIAEKAKADKEWQDATMKTLYESIVPVLSIMAAIYLAYMIFGKIGSAILIGAAIIALAIRR